ncbi:hypothetical protein ACS0TY_021048 [Phlomoides rotata]
MGICCIAKSPHDPNVLLTGSYDECLRIWDVRSTSTPVTESSISLGGGVWRIKHHPSIPGLILTACMHNGFAIVKFRGDEAEIVETRRIKSTIPLRMELIGKEEIRLKVEELVEQLLLARFMIASFMFGHQKVLYLCDF